MAEMYVCHGEEVKVAPSILGKLVSECLWGVNKSGSLNDCVPLRVRRTDEPTPRQST